MSCPGYYPTFQKQLPYGNDCLCFAGAMGADDHTCGRVVPKGHTVRILTGDTSAGTTLSQVNAALIRGYNVDLDVRYGAGRDWFWQQIDNGRSAVVYVGYSFIRNSAHSGDHNFAGTHGIIFLARRVSQRLGHEVLKMDSLCDRRRPGIEDDRGGTWVSQAWADAALDALDLGSSSARGKVWCGLTRDNEPNYQVQILKGSRYAVYTIRNGKIVSRQSKIAKRPITAKADAPHRYLVDKTKPLYRTGHSFNLARIANSALVGKYVNFAQWGKEA